MSSPFRNAILVTVILAGTCLAETPSTQPAHGSPRVIRISADPNNLPFSNDKGEGFENRIAELVAKDLGATIEYHWRAQRRGFFREALKENECDLVLGMPAGFERATPTKPYYRSSYVFVTRTDRKLEIMSFDDPKLREVKIGVQIVGDDYANTPPAEALAARGITDNITGYSLYADYRQPNPPERIMKAVANGDVDVAIVWGPLAGYFSTREAVPLTVTPVTPEAEPSGVPQTFKISIGARKGDTALRDEINTILERREDDIRKILTSFGVPLLPMTDTTGKTPSSAEPRTDAPDDVHPRPAEER